MIAASQPEASLDHIHALSSDVIGVGSIVSPRRNHAVISYPAYIDRKFDLPGGGATGTCGGIDSYWRTKSPRAAFQFRTAS
jgi:hypothetical protein